MRSDAERLRDILEAIERIEKYSVRGREAFEHDELIQNWMVHHLQVIGEAAARLTEAFREHHNAVAWHDVIGMRNILVHDYFGTDLDIVWEAVERGIPSLKNAVREALDP